MATVTGDDSDTDLPGSMASLDVSANPQAVTTSSLDALQSNDSRNVMDIVDKLRRSGLSGILQLPQLVVSGDQSSGKSSVLEAITEIPFPRKENLCTRFATEIILRRAGTPTISTKIIPDKTRNATEKKRLEEFKKTIVDFNELPELMEEATKAMGLGDHTSGLVRAFSRDVLSIEIAGPNRPHLTLVDLPGLIHSENKMQTQQDVELIQGLVNDYIKEKRTIVMAVVSAKNDYANQIILKKCRDVDPKGSRTLGIITKPDFLESGSENEASWIELAENKDIFFELGWHMLKNRSDKEISKSFEQRNAVEKTFFSQGRYRDMSQEMLGIETLRGRLSQLLYKHLKTELPALQKELNDKHREICKELELLGEKRSTPHEQRRFLMGISSTYQNIVKDAGDGHYEHDFFGVINPEERVDHENNMRRLRAVVQFFNLQFASTMRQYGSRQKIEGPAVAADQIQAETELDDDYAQFKDRQRTISRADAVKRVRQIMVRSRGRELPGMFNPLLISQLFWEQSKNWKAIAEHHIEKVDAICSSFVKAAIEFSVSSDVSSRLQTLKIETALRGRLEGAKAELKRIVKDNRTHPITYDPAYTAIVQQTRQNRHDANMKLLMEQAQTADFKDDERYVLESSVVDRMGSLLELDMDKSSAEDALDSETAYYKEEVKYFISAVTKQIIERYLMRDLAADTFSPMLVGDMTENEVTFVAGEPEETTRMRSSLEGRKAVLEKGQQTFRSALGLFK